MIEKLKKKQTKFGYLSEANSLDILDKINELVDAVNEFHEILHYILNESVKNMSWVDSLENVVLELRAKVNGTDNKPIENPTISKMEHVDPYTEQRKWIGKLCWFWYDDKTDKVTGILIGVFDEADRPFERNIDQRLYKHCEPVKPDDDIIYKGE